MHDIDGDGLGAGSPVEYCAADAPEAWVNDCTDDEPFCQTNDTDGVAFAEVIILHVQAVRMILHGITKFVPLMMALVFIF